MFLNGIKKTKEKHPCTSDNDSLFEVKEFHSLPLCLFFILGIYIVIVAKPTTETSLHLHKLSKVKTTSYFLKILLISHTIYGYIASDSFRSLIPSNFHKDNLFHSSTAAISAISSLAYQLFVVLPQ